MSRSRRKSEHRRRTCCTYSRAPGLQSQISARKCAPVLARVGECHKDGRWHFSLSLPAVRVSPFSPTPTGPSSHMHLPSGGASSVPGAADMPPSSVQLRVYHVGPFDLLQLPTEPIASPWTPPTRHVAAWPGVVYQLARNQAKIPETHVSTAFIKVSGAPAWLRRWRSRTY
jgi:hypothetical protein